MPKLIPKRKIKSPDFELFVYARSATEKTKEHKETLRDEIKPWMIKNLPTDHEGHRYLEFDEPLVLEGSTYTGLKLTRKTSKFVDEDLVVKLAASKGLTDRVIKSKMVEYVDADEIYVLNQQGLITDDELDSVFVEEESHALGVMK